MPHFNESRSSDGRHVPAVVVHAINCVHYTFADLNEHCKVYGESRGCFEWLAKAARSHWLERQLTARRTLAKARAIADRNGWNWQSIERAALNV